MKLLIYGKAGKISADPQPKALNLDGIKPTLHGIVADDDDDFLDYMDYDMMEWFDPESEALMRFEYTDQYGPLDLYVVVEYELLEGVNLNENEIRQIIEYTQGQFSDGIGEGFEQHACMEIDGHEIYVSPWYKGQKLNYKYV